MVAMAPARRPRVGAGAAARLTVEAARSTRTGTTRQQQQQQQQRWRRRRRGIYNHTPAATSSSSPSGSGFAVSQREKEEAERLMRWAKEKGAQPIDVFTLRTDPATNVRGVYTSEPLEAGSIICEVPRKLALEVTTAKSKCPIEGLSQEFWNDCDWWAKLGLLLVVEMRQGSASARKEYIEALPKAIPTPLHWTREQLALLRYEALAQDVAEQRAAWDDLYARYCRAAKGVPSGLASQEEFVHAMECVRSRTFSGPYEGSNWETRVKQYALVVVLAVGYVALGLGEVYQAFNGAIGVFLFTLFTDLLVQRNPRSIRYVVGPSPLDSHPSTSLFRYETLETRRMQVEACE